MRTRKITKMSDIICECEESNKNKTPLNILLKDFIHRCNLKNLAKKTIDCYQQNLNQYFDFLKKRGVFYIEDTTQNLFEEYVLLRKKTSASCAQRFIKYYKVLMMRCKNYQIPDFTITLEQIKVPKRKIIGYTDNEVRSILSCCDRETYFGFRTYCIIILMVQCGLRVNEVLNLETKNLWLKEKKIDLKKTKGNKERIIPISDSIRDLLLEFLYVRNNTDEIINNDYVFLSRDNEQLTYSALKCYFDDNIWPYVKISDGKMKGFHNFRRKFASDFMKKNGNLSKLQYMLGHSDPSLTLKCYVNITNEDFDLDELDVNNFIE